MLDNFFLCKIKYEKIVEEGKVQKVSEDYVVHALSFTDAEHRIINEMKPYISGEFEVANIRKIRLWELFDFGDGDRWYRCKINLITFDEESATEKRSSITILAHAGSVREACDVLVKGMLGTLMDNYEITSVVETPIMDVYRDMAPVVEKTVTA